MQDDDKVEDAMPDADQLKRQALVARLQDEARIAPGRYRAKVLALALAGHAVLVALLLFAFGLPLLLAFGALAQGREADYGIAYPIVMCLMLGAVLIRALWIRFDAPEGYRLAPDEAPGLWAEVERLRRETSAPAIDGIVIDGQLNAAAAWAPRLAGVFGYRQYLVLGLPLMALLDRAELASVIAHEFGHFGGGHGRLGGWVYRTRLGWHRVLRGLANGGGGPFAIWLWFAARSYVPYFNAYSFVLAREQEFAADAAAVQATDAATAASALMRLQVGSRRLERTVWPALQRENRARPHPPGHVQASIRDGLRAPIALDGPRVLAIAAREADPDDTHPLLAQRLEAMRATPRLRAVQASGADAWLDAPLRERIERELDLQWRKAERKEWESEYAAAAADRARLAELDRIAAPSAGERVEHARLIESLRGDALAISAWTRVLDHEAGHAVAHHRLGLLALGEGDWPRAEHHLERAIALDPGALKPTADAVERLDGDPDVDARGLALIARFRAAHGDAVRALVARDGVEDADALQAHDLDATTLASFLRVLAVHDKVGRAWLARKATPMLGDAAHYVMLLDWRGSVVSEAAGLRALGDALPLPGSHTVFTDSGHRALARRVRAICPEPIYRRGRTPR